MNKKIWCLSAALLAGSVVLASPVKSAKAVKQATYVAKPSLAEQVLKVVVSGKYRNDYDKFHKVPFEKLPDVCKEACEGAKDIYGKEENTASVAYIDLDCDGSSEMIVTYRHYWGNGGTMYDILTKRNGKHTVCCTNYHFKNIGYGSFATTAGAGKEHNRLRQIASQQALPEIFLQQINILCSQKRSKELFFEAGTISLRIIN